MVRSTPPSKTKQISVKLLRWYDQHRRHLPWRSAPGIKPDPYAVWLSEIMLQQTTVQAVKSYYTTFLNKWPRIQDLANAPLEDVLKAWAGLGYYSRARNLHACALVVANEHAGQFPQDEIALRALPGIGPYTSAAIAAIAFDQRAIVIDGNVERVIARLNAIREPLPKSKPIIRSFAQIITPHQRAGDFAQAMMDLGATICTPRRPACTLCPIHSACAAALSNEAENFPRKLAKAQRPLRRGAAFFVMRQSGHVLVRTRPPKGLLGGMTEIPGTQWSEDFTLANAKKAAPLKARWRQLNGEVEHVFTHFSLSVTVFAAAVPDDSAAPEGCRWVAKSKLDKEALPSIMRKVIAHAESWQDLRSTKVKS